MDPNTNPFTLSPEMDDRIRLNYAVETGNIHQLRLLLAAQDVYPPSEGIRNDLLRLAVRSSQMAVVEFLRKNYPPNEIESPAISSAIISGSKLFVSVFLSSDPLMINRQFMAGGTPLILACMSGQQPEFLKFLLDQGADPDMKCMFFKFSVLECLAGMYQALHPGTRAIDLMLEYGAKINEPDVLMAAVRQGREDIVGYLLRLRLMRAELERDPHDKSVLHVAASGGFAEIMRILLEHGVDVNSKNEHGKTTMQVVENIEREEGRDMKEVKELLNKQLAMKR
ncbi:hypothetical protein FSARC_12660 [Fusarium sarcochroum]|uniref:Ankyrin n=1 Tax=Fusarium sarcochroum TaxID=1208366 RepID=A0A8H4T6Q0_9HYPO|nr:hypothetical protein FSARC_12660 [Fusarium sarcochroum]